jgi:hypothetical protein
VVKHISGSDGHDPILGDEWSSAVWGNDFCAACLAARNSTFAQLRKIAGDLGPYDTDEFVARMQEMAQAHLQAVTT